MWQWWMGLEHIFDLLIFFIWMFLPRWRSPVTGAQMCGAPDSLYPQPPSLYCHLNGISASCFIRGQSEPSPEEWHICLSLGWKLGMPVIPQLPSRSGLYLKGDLILHLVVICCQLETRMETSQPCWLCSLPEWFSRSSWRGLQPWPWCFWLCTTIAVERTFEEVHQSSGKVVLFQVWFWSGMGLVLP